MPGDIGGLVSELFPNTEPRLLLFDIDGTLVDTGGQGMAALHKTAIEVFGAHGPPLDLAGSTDLGILESLHSHFGVEPCDARTSEFFAAYHQNLEASLIGDKSEGRVLGGVCELLDHLASLYHAQLGLLTGNTEHGAAIKLRHFRLDHYFSFGAYGSDRSDRNLLGGIALERALDFTGRQYHPRETLVIGDTPKDILCAHAIGARCLAVATGRFSPQDLNQAGADWVIESFLDLPLQSC